MGMRLVLLAISIVMTVPVLGQRDSVASRLEKIRTCDNDSLRLACAEEIVTLLKCQEFGSYDMVSPVKYLGYKKCINADAELYSWSIPVNDGAVFYNLFRFKEGGRDYLLRSVPGEGGVVSPYLFYDFLAFKSDRDTYFVLLGWNYTKNTNQKVVLVARFGEDGHIGFNNRLLRRGESRSASLAFEYARDGSMTLKHDQKGRRIVFDHLAPSDKKYEGYFMFYGPDASYDALELKKGEWWYKENIKIKGDR